MLLYYQYSNSLWMIKWYTRTHTHCLLLLLLHTTTTVDPLDPAPFKSWPPGPAPVPLKSKKTLPALNNYYELYIIIRKIFILVLPILPNYNNTKKTSNGRQKVSFFLFDDKLITTKLRKRRKKKWKIMTRFHVITIALTRKYTLTLYGHNSLEEFSGKCSDFSAVFRHTHE